MDFTISTYKKLIRTFHADGYTFQPFAEFLTNPAAKVIILRHDVDRLPENSLIFARIQQEMGIKGTYYFRVVPESWDENIIKEISGLGHEIGYHYEDLGATAQRRNGIKAEEELVEIAIGNFEKNLERLRQIAQVKTICMHGSPLSKWDNRLLWKYYDYRDNGIIGEPYFDIDFSKVLYLTDTGRQWNGDSFNIRDNVSGVRHLASGIYPFPDSISYFFHSTSDLITAAEARKLPDAIMITFHPQRWTNKVLPWIKELVFQNVKNVGKLIVKKVGSRQ